MSTRLLSILAALCGILGVAALAYYYSVPFPLPPPDATAAQVTAFGTQYHDTVLLDTWFQATGSLLVVAFVVALVHLAGAMKRMAGWMTLLAAGLVAATSLSEGTFTIAAVEAGALGHTDSAMTSFDLTNVFVHVFLIGPAPVFFLALGAVLLGSSLLPRVFSYLALALGGGFETLGFAGLFSATAVSAGTFLLIGQELWLVAAAVTLLLRAGKIDAAPAAPA